MNKEQVEFFFNVYEIVKEIPVGCVATYGQIASLVGKPQWSRMVGRALRYSSLYDKVPSHRVVNSLGRLVPY